MEAARWIRGLASLPGVALLAGAGLGSPLAPGAAPPPWQPPPCPASTNAGSPALEPAPAAWFRVDGVLDRSGTLAGRRLTLGTVAGPRRVLELPPESFASGPVRGRLVIGDDDGSRSRLRVVDVARACVLATAVEADVIRSAVLSADSAAIAEHRVARDSRADLGVWRREAALDTAIRVLPGLPPDPRYGPTFTTELRWTDGALGVSSCGSLACRNRLQDPATGRVTSIEATGPMIGAHGTTVLAYDTCHGFPCAILAIDTATGQRDVLVPDAGPAALGGAGADVLVVAAADGSVEVIDIRAPVRRPVVGSRGLVPVPTGSLATIGIEVPTGDVAAAAGGTVGDPTPVHVIRPDTGVVVGPVGEASR